MITPKTPPFDPIQLAKTTQAIICRPQDTARKYTNIYVAGVYGGIATAYAVGCSLRCIFCWVDDSREFPDERGRFYTPGKLVDALWTAASRKGVKNARISGAEPTLCKDHLLQVLPLIDASALNLFILETNGILLGADRDYVRQITSFDKVHIRVSLKAASPEGFQRRTGAQSNKYELPFTAIRSLLDFNANFHVAAMTDPRLMPPEEYALLIERLNELDPRLVTNLEEEICEPYPSTRKRLAASGVDTASFFIHNEPIYT